MASAIIRTDGNARRLDDRYDAFLEELVVEARSHDVVANVSLSLLWVTSGHFAAQMSCPLFCRRQTAAVIGS
jgi:hypothetical protein